MEYKKGNLKWVHMESMQSIWKLCRYKEYMWGVDLNQTSSFPTFGLLKTATYILILTLSAFLFFLI